MDESRKEQREQGKEEVRELVNFMVGMYMEGRSVMIPDEPVNLVEMQQTLREFILWAVGRAQDNALVTAYSHRLIEELGQAQNDTDDDGLGSVFPFPLPPSDPDEWN